MWRTQLNNGCVQTANMKSAILFQLASAIHLFDNGVLLEEMGNLYLTHDHVEYNVHINRPFPYKQFNNLQFDKCQCDSTTIDFSCPLYTKLQYSSQIRYAYEKQIKQLETEANKLGYQTRHRRGAFGLIAGLANFGFNLYQEKEIHDLQSVALKNAQSASRLADGILDNRQAIKVLHDGVESDIKNLDAELCQSSQDLWKQMMRDRATEITEQYLSQIEQEVVSFMEGNLPLKIEYINLFHGLCLKSCAGITATDCETYCTNRINHLPVEMSPRFQTLHISKTGAIISVNFKLPKLKLTPKQLYKTKPFGILMDTDHGVMKRTPQLSQFAADFSDNFMEINEKHCIVGFTDLICTYASINFESCLKDTDHCSYNIRPSTLACTFTYTDDGLAVFALQPAFIQNSITMKAIGTKHSKWTGLKFIQSSAEDQQVRCARDQTIDVPSYASAENITVNIINQFLPSQNISIHHILPKAIQLAFNSKLDSVKDNEKYAHDILHRNNWILISGLIIVFFLGIIITIVVMKKFKSSDKQSSKFDGFIGELLEQAAVSA